MPSPKPGNFKVGQQHQARLTNRRSFGSADSNHSSVDSNHSSYDLDNITDVKQFNDDKKNKEILNNNNISQSMRSDNQQNSNNSNNNNNSNNSNSNNGNNSKNDNTWWRKFNPSLTLENNASVARDHLANERTFLAWLRTSLSFISIGIAITQLLRITRTPGIDQQQTSEYDKEGKLIGIVFIILGIIFLSFGITRYFHSQYLMTKGHFPASRGSVVIGTILTIMVLATFFIVIIINDGKR